MRGKIRVLSHFADTYVYMLQPLESRLTRLARALAPRAASIETPPSQAPVGSILTLPLGDVAADFRPTGTPDRARNAIYELVVANESPTPLATFAYAQHTPGNRSDLTWSAIVVPPFSAIAVEIGVKLPRRGVKPRVIAELYADDAKLTLDAPPHGPGRGIPKVVAAIAAGLALLGFGVGAYAQNRPRVFAVAAPSTVVGGSPFLVAYATGHGRESGYVVETPDGLQVRKGRLTHENGSFSLSLPTGSRSSGYDIRLWTTGRMGNDERIAHVVAVPARPLVFAPPVRIGAISVEHDVVHSGDDIIVNYRASAATGYVRLVDSLGTVRAEALLNHRGQSIIVAPLVAADADFRVVVDVQGGETRDEIETAVTILKPPMAAVGGSGSVGTVGAAGSDGNVPPPASPAVAPAVAADGTVPSPTGGLVQPGTAGTVATAADADPIAVARDQIVGRPITVTILRHEGKLHLALMGGISTAEIVGTDVAADQDSVALTPPTALAAGRYEIVTTYESGVSTVTLVHGITVRVP